MISISIQHLEHLALRFSLALLSSCEYKSQVLCAIVLLSLQCEVKYGFGSLQYRHKHDGSEQLDRIRGVRMNKDMMDL